MKRLFLSITKGEEIRFLGHLDFLRTLERAIQRAALPVAFSEGFNPHMRFALDAALGVGVAADPIWLELRLSDDTFPASKVEECLAPQLLPGISIHGVMDADMSWPKLINWFTEDCYEAEGPTCGIMSEAALQEEIQRFNSLESFIYERVTPKKTRQMDVIPMLTAPLSMRIEGDRAYLQFSLVRSTSGTVQPKDLWKIMAESFHVPVTPGEFVVKRTGVYHLEGGRRLTPFDIGAFPDRKQGDKKK